uniref:Uncharacterized protein n=1 Tax=Odontella aurita TaxID=265563 RepID=A0A7S4IVZ7_9STRA|eukprot:CAMPEP_0113582818 /NCGR_PEP_ID=MMETSP0015_2-20120614/32147_1 /TAXON_ID=2838 /ORGANISM="Odontella" /LENGTH=251 /DNA_ID=CAMNT_0000487575 /DNA_START=72 /DNA_END=827 /DNA_ORIENTATION=+ /assembly_acc=CAM_ASM_000160
MAAETANTDIRVKIARRHFLSGPLIALYVTLLLGVALPVTAFTPASRSNLINCRKGIDLNSTPEPKEDGDDDELSITRRFLSPRIDDRGLPIADALVAQIVAPSFHVFWLGINQSPLPSWLRVSLWAPRGSMVAPTLIHGAGLACCWVAGALAGRAFESEAFDVSEGRGYGTVISRTFQAGAFATGLLILSTQIDLLLEFGRTVQWGESEETDRRLLVAAVEVINDIFFEALTLSGWRLYRASKTADGNKY